jgi:hypothetical protein
MIQAGLDPNFPEKSADELLLIGLIAQQDLHRLEPLGDNVFNLEHTAHPTSAKHTDNLVITDGIARPERHQL